MLFVYVDGKGGFENIKLPKGAYSPNGWDGKFWFIIMALLFYS